MSAADVDFPSDLRSLESEYELIRELGQGGMAAVYLARQRATGRLVAIKAIRARYLDDPDAIKRFAREARTVAGLDHPNIIKTEAIRQIDDRAVAIVMEHAPGGTVRDRLREFGSLGAEDAETILRDVASALGYAHGHGIVHRDVKPENIFLDPTRRRALLSDFGIARSIDHESAITLLGAALGTPQYMSPEQIDGQMVDGRSDIYSLGVLGWELLTGRRPWAGESLYGVIYKQKHEDLPRITSLRPRVPANLLFAIEGALVKDKAGRWQTIDEFLNQLTYNPPPVLSQTYPPGAAKRDYEPTVQFRSATLQPDEADSIEPIAQVVETQPVGDTLTHFTLTPTDLDAVERGAAVPAAGPNEASLTLSFAGGEYTLPGFDPNAVPAYDRPPRGRRIAQVLGLLVPISVAGASLFVLLSGSTNQSTRRASMEVSSSAGTVAADSAPVSRTVLASPARPVFPDSPQVPAPRDVTIADTVTTASSTMAAPSTAIDPPARRTSRGTRKRAGAATARSPATAGKAQRFHAESVRVAAAPGLSGDSNNLPATRMDGGGTRDSTEPIDDPFRIPASGPKAPKALGKGAVPSPRCRLASSADQQTCLAAYISFGDAPLDRAFDSLIGEYRRVAGTELGGPDPATVQRLRIEQRAWLAVRENECPRMPPAGVGPFWAEAQSACFSEMASARARELSDAVKRLRRRH